jgi:hypothetical protein
MVPSEKRAGVEWGGGTISECYEMIPSKQTNTYLITISYILKLHGVCSSVRLSVRSGADLGFRTSTDGQDQVLKSRSLDGRGGR